MIGAFSSESHLPVCVVEEGGRLSGALVEGPEANGEDGCNEPQVVVTTDEATVGTESTAETCEEGALTEVPRLEEAWLALAQRHVVSTDGVSSEDAIDFGDFGRRDLAELLAEVERFKLPESVLVLRSVLPRSERGTLDSFKIVTSRFLVSFEELRVRADTIRPRS